MTTMVESIDPAKVEEFMGKLTGDLTGALTNYMLALGDRLGLFKDLAAKGPTTSEGLATRTGLNERYLREWLSALACAGYVDYDPSTRQFRLPAEHAFALADETSPAYMGGFFSFPMVMEKAGTLTRLAEAFRSGGGVSQEDYGEDAQVAQERMSAPSFDHALVEWLAALPDVCAKLEAGGSVADVGCGAGRALIRLAQAFPKSTFSGFDLFRPAITLARAKAMAAGVDSRIQFEVADASEGIPGQYDLITTFEVVHDAPDPRGLLAQVRKALKPDGTYLVLESGVGETLEDNIGPVGALYYGVSVLYCMTTSLAAGGEGLGAAGLPESRLRELCLEAGFRSVRKLPIEIPLYSLYEVKA